MVVANPGPRDIPQISFTAMNDRLGHPTAKVNRIIDDMRSSERESLKHEYGLKNHGVKLGRSKSKFETNFV